MYSENNHLNNQLKLWMLTLLVLVSLIILVGGLTRLTDSGLSITTWELFVGFFPPFTNEKWLEYFSLYKTIPEYSQQNYNMSLDEFKVIFWWEWAHRFFGRVIGLAFLISQLSPVLVRPKQLLRLSDYPVWGTVSHLEFERINKKNNRRLLVFLASSGAIVMIYGVLIAAEIMNINIAERFF